MSRFLLSLWVFRVHIEFEKLWKLKKKKLLLKNVHFHWRFKKSKFFKLTFTNDFFFDFQFESSALLKKSFYTKMKFDDFDFELFSIAEKLIHDRRNRIESSIVFSHSKNLIHDSRNRIKSSIVFFYSKNNDLSDLKNIAEFEKAKIKKRSSMLKFWFS